MILFNITIKVDTDVNNDFVKLIGDDWLSYIKEGLVQPSRFFRLLGVDTTDGITYCLQHYFTDQTAFNMYKIDEDMAFHAEMADRYGDKLVIFSSVLLEV